MAGSRPRVRVKICGLTRAADAAAAVAAGADYLGVVFAGGPRQVGAPAAAAVRAAAGAVPLFGVFGDQSVDEILRLRDAAGLAGAQLHGAYHPPEAARLRREGLRVWRVVRLAGSPDPGVLRSAALEAEAVLVEPRVPHAMGGGGVALDLAVAQEARRHLGGGAMVLAGGLTPETVAAAVGLVGPEAVDVSSGVEYLPGRKDPDKIARCLEAVFGHSADC